MFSIPLLVVAVAGSGPAASDLDTPVLPPNAYLVKASAVHVGSETGRPADFVIEHVYAGDDDLKGQHFVLSDYLLRNGSHQNKDLPIRVEGEVGLWWVGRRVEPWVGASDADGKLFTYNDLRHSLPPIYWPFPAVLKGGAKSDPGPSQYGGLPSDPYDFGPARMLAWAEAIGKVYRAKGDDDRIALLKGYAPSDNPPLSAWAINTLARFLDDEGKAELSKQDRLGVYRDRLLRTHALARQVRPDVRRTLEGYADSPKLTVYAQVELDEVLTRIEGDDWLTSDRRKAMLARWKEVKDPRDRYFINDRLKASEADK